MTVMPILAAVVYSIAIAMAFHAVKTGRFWPWFYIIMFLPGLGAFAYLIMELLPEWTGSYQGQRARARISRAIDPEKTYRALKNDLEIANTISNREALAQECLA